MSTHLSLHRFAKRWRWRCVYCGRTTVCITCNAGASLKLAATRDHVVPRARGGPSNLTNLVLACQECNQAKADRLIDAALPTAFLSAVEVRVRAERRIRPHPGPLTVPIWRACADGWYKSQRQAETAARAIFTATGRQFEAYLCQFCPQWHLARTTVDDEETA